MDNTTVSQDSSFNLDELINLNSESPTTEIKKTNELGKSTQQKEMSPLDKMLEEKSSVRGFENDGREVSDEPVKLRHMMDSDERRDDMTHKLQEQDDFIEKVKYIAQIRKTRSSMDNAELMNEISMTKVDPETGQAIVPEGARFIIPKYIAEKTMVKVPKTNETIGSGEYVDDIEITEEMKQDAQKGQLVKILIDKTKFGANIEFTDEEKKIVSTASAIHLIEVEEQEIQYAQFERVDEDLPFIDSIDKYQLNISKVPMAFPGSGFRAEMAGLSWGEFSDITLDTRAESTDYLSFEKMNRKFSIIYNKLMNPNIGLFNDYTDFLKKFAYSDVPYAVFGLLIATQPEQDVISLRCRNNGCNRGFNHTYIPRNIIDWESASTDCLQKIKEINTVSPEKAMIYAKNSGVRKIRRFKLPNSNFMVDIGLASCYDYLYGILGLINQWHDEELPQDDARWELLGLLHGVRGIIVTTKEGKQVRYSSAKNIIEVIVNLVPSEDIQIITALYEKYAKGYTMNFFIKDIECPHCGFKTRRIAITPDELVFRIYQRQRSSEIILDNFPNS